MDKTDLKKLKLKLQKSKLFRTYLISGLILFTCLSLLISSKVNDYARELENLSGSLDGKTRIDVSQCEIIDDGPLCISFANYRKYENLMRLTMLPTYIGVFLFWWVYAWSAFDEVLKRNQNRS